MSTPDEHIREPRPGWVGDAPSPPELPEDDFGPERRLRGGPRQEDLNHLRLLVIFHYVVGAMAALCATLPVLHLVVGIGMLTGSFPTAPAKGPPPPRAFALMFVLFLAAMIVAGWAFAVCLIVAGRMLSHRRRYTFCLVTAGLACMFQPAGMVLGIFTIIVLIRPSVKELFRAPAESSTAVDSA